MRALWGVLAALAAVGEGRGAGGGGGGAAATPGARENGSEWGGGGAALLPRPPPGGPWGSLGGSLGVLAAAYLGLGGAVLVGLHLRHRALRNRKRRRVRREAARRFFRVSPPEPQNPYGNITGPAPPAPQPRPPGDDVDGDEEGEGDEGYEEPDNGSYENAPAMMGGGAGGPYEAMAAAMMAGAGLGAEPPWRGRGNDDDSASYENMEGPLG
ncbi:uncharacterized protein LOC141731703 [Zonotrichia albicollis]|uniref:uncharacterized protein LOC141731703 n=1 Tax=Zonotrichia albicollis TaxID=44394 RepID=UPI003D80E52A